MSKDEKTTAAAKKRLFRIQAPEHQRRRCQIASAAAVAAAAARKLVRVPRVRMVGRRAEKITGTTLGLATTSTTFGVGAGEHELSPAARSSLLPTNSLWAVAPYAHECSGSRYMERNTGSCLQWYCLTGLCGVSACVDAWNPRFQRMTSQCGGTGLMSCRTYQGIRYRVNVKLNLPASPAPEYMF